MSSEKLWKIPLFSIPIFVAHGIEEYLTYSYDNNATFESIGNIFQVSGQTGFLIFQAIWWLALIITVIIIKKKISILSQLAVLALAGIYLFELEHPIHALIIGGYYPGLITSIPLVIFGFYFWKTLLRFDAIR